MFVGHKLLYLEMPKTACSHIRSLLKETVGGVIIGKHNPLTDYPVPFYVAGSVRNPWAWYVSLWAFGCVWRGAVRKSATRPQPFLQRLREPRRPVKDWYAVYRDADDPACFRAWLRMVSDPARSADFDEGYGAFAGRAGVGFMTYRYLLFHTRGHEEADAAGALASPDAVAAFYAEHRIADGIIQTESLGDDLLRVLAEAGYELGAEAVARIRSTASVKTNTSKHRDTAYYYDEASIEVVRERERFLVDLYGYAPPAPAATAAA